ncbi:N-domain protein, SNF2 family [Faecalibacterium sp. An121]|nr:N-domain protein, SNF2 family [Faecalibacterium sp. An121]
MSEKTLYYAQLAEDTARRLTGNWERWAGFLATASRLYKYHYPDQLMIYAQRPDATACASYDVWNDRMNRYVRRGSKGIALLDDTGDRLRLRYVFDLADTGTRPNSRDPWLWTLEDRHGIPVKAMLERRYGTTADTLPQQLADAAGQLADAYWADHRQKIGGILANSMLEEYDELNRGLAFKRAVTASTTFALLSRCGYSPEKHFDHEEFSNIYAFDTPATVAALGTAVSESSREVLLQIAAVVRQVERDIAEERRLWDEQHSIAVHAERGLSGPEHRAESAADALGQVRADAPDVSQGEPADSLQSPAAERETVPAPGGDRPSGEAAARTDDARTDAGSGRNGGAESSRPDAVDQPDERLQSAGRGSDPERADLQLSFFATEAEQIAQIDQRAETEQVSAFSFSEADWWAALASGSGFEHGKERIAAYYAENHSAKERTAFLKQEYGTGGRSWTFQDGSNGFLDYDASGIKLRSYPNGQEQRLKWPEVEKRIHVLIATGRYLSETEPFISEVNDTRTEGEILREKLAERGIINGQVIDPEKLDSDPFIRQVVADAEATKETVSAQFQKTLTAEDVTDIRLESSSYSAVSREKEYHLSCKINGVPDTLVYTVSQHDDGEGFTIRSGQREEDDIWKKMPQPELEKLEAVLAQTVEFDYWSKSIEHAADADALEVVAQDYRWAEDLNLSDEQRDALWVQIEARKEQLTTQPAIPTEPMAAYPAEETHLPYDVVVERLHVDQPQSEIPAPPARNFRITDEHLGEGGPKQKFARNIEAIRILQTLENENRNATPEEQEILSRYVGWGGLADAFDPDKDSWAKEYTQLKELLSPEEYAAARASTLNAHYTSPTVIRAIYDTVEQMGFTSGNILEPSMGVGNFFGMLPESMQGSRLYGVELDSITGRIARQLYPEATITVAGFETTSQRDFYDLAVGNVPFGNYKVNDKAYNNLGFSIHNYFFAKALDQVRPGGIVAFVTSRFTMDSKDSSARKYLAQRADLLGAVRLPNNAFKANAGTEVVSDILFLQKLDRPIDREPEWVQVGQTPEGFTINQYFVDHPDMVLGELSAESTQYGREDVTVNPIEGADLAEQLKSAMAHINGRYEAVERVNTELDEGAPDVLPADPNVKNFSYTVVEGEVYYRENSVMTPVELSDDAKDRVKGMVGLRSIVNELIAYQLEDFPDADIADKQAELNAAYDAFSAKYGLLNDRKNGRLFEDDSSYYLLCSLENLDENGKLKSKADMFTKRTIRPERAVTHVDTPAEALAVSIGEKGRVDLPYMAELLGTPEDFERITGELRSVIFQDPSDQNWKTADEYLSGNVRNKLQIAKLAAANDPAFEVNVEALTKAQPKELEASEIDVRLGATWISPDIIQKFMNETFQIPFYLRYAIRVKFSPATAEWRIEGKTKTGHNDVMAYETFGTVRASAYKILEDTLNLRDARVYDTVEDDSGKPKRVLNKKETMLAGQKQQAIKDAFANWVWQDPQRRESLVKQYNELFNSTRPREYDGSHIHFVGMNPEITLREHQRNAIAHVLYGGNTLLAHEVGAGKTFEMAASAMEAKRLGLCQKSLFVVPNHLTLQWAQEFLHLYPSAKLLVASKKDFETANRKKFCARIATGDYDAVIIGHSQFEKIPLSFERQERIIQEQIDEIQSGIAELKHSSGEKFTIKQMEKSRKQLEMKLEKLRATERKDDVVTFEELGVDRLFVDESHHFKNLFLVTKMRNVAGLSTSEAQKSSDMFGKCRYMDELTGGRGVVFATGTPVSNSMVELFTVMRYLQYGTLQQKGLTHFDCWASTFGETTTSIELAPEGTGYRARTRFAKFFNLPELMTMFKEVADIKTSDQLHLPVPEAKFETVLVKPSEIQKEMVQSLSERAGKINAGMVDASEDNMLCVTNDGRKIGLDQRLMNPLLPDDPNSKLNACVRNVLRIWEEGKEDRLTQLLFCDLSTPKGDGQFNVYDDVKKKLLAAGVPESEVAFIHAADTEAKKKELFSKVRTGQVRILLGSTAKMGAGTNVQDRLVAVHHLDVGWKPSDMTQRNGRIIRQGNRNKEVQIYQYVTEGTFDAYLYQTLENKQRFIGQIMTSKSPVRSCEDVDEQVLSYAEVKALCAGNPLIKEKMNLDVEVAKLKVLKADHQSQKYRLEDKLLKEFPASIQCQKAEIAALQQDAKVVESNPQVKDGFCGMTVKGMHFEDKLVAGERLLLACKEMPTAETVTLGSYRGFGLDLRFDTFRNEYQAVLRGATSHFVPLGTDARGNLTRLDNALDSFSDRIARAENQLQTLYQQRDAAQVEVEKPFPKEAELAEKSARLAELDALLNMESRPEPEREEPETEPDERGEEHRPSVLAGLKAAATEKPARDKAQKKEEPER